MIINGLGFCGKPRSLTPYFFKTKALEQLFPKGVQSEYFNCYKLGKVLDEIKQPIKNPILTWLFQEGMPVVKTVLKKVKSLRS